MSCTFHDVFLIVCKVLRYRGDAPLVQYDQI